MKFKMGNIKRNLIEISRPGKALGLDPSSTAIGYALMADERTLIEAGRITPLDPEAEAAVRIESMAWQLRKLLDAESPAEVMIEIPSGHVGKKRHKGKGFGLSIYGMGVGMAWGTVLFWRYQAKYVRENTFVPISLVPENVWTGGVIKADRILGIKSLFPQYEPATDPEGDSADAIGVAHYVFKERRIKR